MNIAPDFKAGYITIVGKPNVGKSTLMNRLLNFRLSITSPRPQTTRKSVMGILTEKDCQIVFNDTAGLLEPRYKLQKAMMRSMENAVNDADGLMFMTDDRTVKIPGQMEHNLETLRAVNKQKKPVILVINKVDLFQKEKLLPVIDFFAKEYSFAAIVPVSALKGDGIEELKSELKKVLPYHPPFYDPDTVTDHPERFLVAELIREQVFLQFQMEIPYSSEVQIEEFTEREHGKDYISATIIVERESQKGILIGKKGAALKSVGERARKRIEELLGRSVFLELRVKVRKSWRKNEQILKRLGY